MTEKTHHFVGAGELAEEADSGSVVSASCFLFAGEVPEVQNPFGGVNVGGKREPLTGRVALDALEPRARAANRTTVPGVLGGSAGPQIDATVVERVSANMVDNGVWPSQDFAMEGERVGLLAFLRRDNSVVLAASRLGNTPASPAQKVRITSGDERNVTSGQRSECVVIAFTDRHGTRRMEWPRHDLPTTCESFVPIGKLAAATLGGEESDRRRYTEAREGSAASEVRRMAEGIGLPERHCVGSSGKRT